MKKILAITTIRSDYDLLSGIYKLLHESDECELQLLVSGAHLSKKYGYSVKQIEADGFNVLLKIETLIDSDSKLCRIKTASLLLQNSLDVICQYDPDVIMYAGDREDVLVGSMIGGYLQIPTIHFFGGDHVFDGHIDNPVRHATSKMSTIHFVTIDEHRQRLIDMGEDPRRVFTVGNPSLDRFHNVSTLGMNEINAQMGTAFKEKEYVLVIFHPSDDEIPVSEQFENILKALLRLNVHAFISYPNTDPGNFEIMNIIEKYKTNEMFCFYKNLGRKTFLSIYKKTKAIVGNSSSGITEAASIPIPVLNVGRRQMGRFAGENVVFCSCKFEDIVKNVKDILSDTFMNKIKNLINPYGDGNSSRKAYELIKTMSFSDLLLKTEDPLRRSNHE